MQNPFEETSAIPAPIPSGAKRAAANPPSSAAATGYTSQPAAEQRQRQPYRPLQDGGERDHSPDYNPYGDGPTSYPPLPSFKWSAEPTPAESSSFSMSAPLQSFNNIRKGNARPWKLFLSYGADWALTIGLTAAFFLLDGVSGFKREFDLNDTSIQHTFAVHERIPNWMLVCICFGAPILLLPLINFATVRSLWDWHISSLGLILSLGLTGTITNVVKICVGRPRPDLIDRCQPIAGSVNAAVYGLSNHTICTQTDRYILNDGFRSFPSGHSSLSFAGLGFLSLYLAGKLHLFDMRGHTGKSWLSVTPLVGAALTAVSRTMDNRHHWQDVTTGSILGITIAFFSYRQFYPPLGSATSHKPYSPRIPRGMPGLPTHRRDISESQMPLTSGLHPGYPTSQPRERTTSPPRQYSIPVNAGPYAPPEDNRIIQRQNPFEDSPSRTPVPQDDDEPVATYAAPMKPAGST